MKFIKVLLLIVFLLFILNSLLVKKSNENKKNNVKSSLKYVENDILDPESLYKDCMQKCHSRGDYLSEFYCERECPKNLHDQVNLDNFPH
jgi:hypothetical protein